MRITIRRAIVALAAGTLAGTAAAQSNNGVRIEGPAPEPFATTVPEMTNLGELRTVEFEGHDLSLAAGAGGILYAPSEADDPAYRDALSIAAGGATVDYFDARADTPTLGLLQNYECVVVWANFGFFDAVAYGDVLADFVDGGGRVILGAFTTYTQGTSLQGRIMTVGYAPVVSPTGGNAFSLSAYVGDGTSCIYDGVGLLECEFRDLVVLQGAGIADGSWADGEICHAYRPDGRVVFSSGAGGTPVTCTGDGAVAVANACSCIGGSAVDCVCDGVYDVGDRVALLVDNPDGNADLLAGARGTVICGGAGSPPLLVLWDEFDGGHDGNGLCACPANGGGFSGGPVVLPGATGWYVGCDEVALVSACPADLDLSGDVGFGDLLEVLTGWGPCP